MGSEFLSSILRNSELFRWFHPLFGTSLRKLNIISCPHIPKCLQSAQLLIHAVPGRAALLAEPLPPRNWFTWISAVPVVLLGGLAAGGGGCGCGGCCFSCDWKEEISEYREVQQKSFLVYMPGSRRQRKNFYRVCFQQRCFHMLPSPGNRRIWAPNFLSAPSVCVSSLLSLL